MELSEAVRAATHGDVRLHALPVLALRDDDDPLLNGPAEYDLCLCRAKTCGDAFDRLIREECRELLTGRGPPERRVRGEHDVVLRAVLAYRHERQARMKVDLIGHRNDLRLGEEGLQERNAEA